MQIPRSLLFLLLGVTAPAWAQSSAPPLNLQLPADAVAPAQHPVAEAAKDSGAANPAAPASPELFPLEPPYDETYGMRRDAAARACDDRIYGQPQIHGSVGMGVAAGSHGSGNYQTATIAASKALGSCDDPKGFVGGSISVGQGNNNFHRGGRP